MSEDIKRSIIRHSKDVRPMKSIYDSRHKKRAFEYIKKLREEDGLNYTQIGERLMKEGWRGKNGSKLPQAVVSAFMTENNYRILGLGPIKRRRKVKPEELSTEGPEPVKLEQRPDIDPLKDTILQILNNEIPWPMQKKLIKAALNEE